MNFCAPNLRLRSALPTSFAFVAAIALFAAPPVAKAGELSVTVSDATGADVPVEIENGHEFDVTVIGVRITVEDESGEMVHYFSQGSLTETLAAGESWSGTPTFATSEGAAPPPETDWRGYDRVSVAVAVDLDALAPGVDAAVETGTFEALTEQLALIRARVAPVSRTARFHEVHIAASGMPTARYFDLERIDGMVARLERATCDWASEQVIEARGSNEARQEAYNALSEQLRTVGLHINCLNSEGKLVAARMLLEGSRPQDALLFKELDEDGNLKPEWVPIFTQANLALARTAAELGVQNFSSIRPAIEALNAVQDLDPENEEMLRIAVALIPNAAQWVIRASGPIERDLDSAQEALELIRPRWSRFEKVEEAAAVFAGALIEAGLEYCERREYINARNRFIRGERMLEGIEVWEARASEINRCRALGALEEGREMARHPTDDQGPARGYEKLDEALSRFDLSDEEVASFEADIAAAWVDVALRQLETEDEIPKFAAAERSLINAEEQSPTGRTDGIRSAWLRYAERMAEYHGFTMSGAHVEQAREAVAKAEEVDPERVAAVSAKLTRAYYGYRIGIPAIALLLGLIAGLVAWSNKRKAQRMAALDVDELPY